MLSLRRLAPGLVALILLGCPDPGDDDATVDDDDDTTAGDDDTTAGDDDTTAGDDDTTVGDDDTTVDPDLGHAHATFVGEAAQDHSGTRCAGAGDVDADGLDDILIGAPYNDQGGSNAGKAYLVLGGSVVNGGGFCLAGASASFVGEMVGDQAGWSVASAGDVDQDGLGDVLIGAPYTDGPSEDSGRAYLFHGSTVQSGGSFDLSDADVQFYGAVADGNLGLSLASAGDVDDDGRPDLLFGAPFGLDGGTAYLVFGDSTLGTDFVSMADADVQFVREGDGGRCGWSVASAGDVDGDGLDDVLVGSPYQDVVVGQEGKVHLVLGSALTAVVGDLDLSMAHAGLEGDGYQALAGFSLSSAGDVDGDGRPDLLVGSHGHDGNINGRGMAYLVLASRVQPGGDFQLSLADAKFAGAAPADYAGYAVAGAGDLDGDGLGDLLVGAPYNDLGQVDGGTAHVLRASEIPFPGAQSLGNVGLALLGEDPGDSAGISLASAGDVDGDGWPDVLVGSTDNADGGSYAGKTYLVLGPF